MQTEAVRNRHEDQSGSGEGGASGASLNSGTARMAMRTATGSNQPLNTSMSQHAAVDPLEVADTSTKTRQKWSTIDNEDVMRAYFLATTCETEKVGFRKKMLIEWRKTRPNSQLTEGRIASQLYAIKKRKLLTELEIQNILCEIKRQTDGNNETSPNNADSIQPPAENDTVLTIREENTVTDEEPTTTAQGEDDDKDSGEIINNFRKNLILFAEMHPETRPSLPKIRPTIKTTKCVEVINKEIPNVLSVEDQLSKTHAIVYCTAYTAIEYMGKVIKRRTRTTDQEPKWRKRIQKTINQTRSTLTKISTWERGNQSHKLNKEVKKVLKDRKIKIGSQNYRQDLEKLKDFLKQKIILLGKRLRRYNKSLKRKTENKLFHQNEKEFYKSLEIEQQEEGSTPTKESLENYWRSIWKSKGDHTESSPWFQMEKERCDKIEQMHQLTITAEHLGRAITKTHNWKAAGNDHIHNYWWKKIAIRDQLIAQLNRIIRTKEELPSFLTKGKTFMIPKASSSEDPSKYRPITCLPTLFKIITAIIADTINRHVEAQGIITEEQKGCRCRTYGCKEQLLIDTVVTQNAKNHNRNIAIAWIDYQKAFDSVPHSWLIEVLRMYKIDPNLAVFLETSMKSWRTTLHLKNKSTNIETNEIPIQSGIFQGDALSPIWFILALNPLSKNLQASGLGYKLKHIDKEYTLSHLFYVDDLKLYAGSERILNRLIQITAEFSSDIKMSFGMEKCAKLVAYKGKPQTYENIESDTTIKYLNQDTYKYLGYEQNLIINKSETKTKLEDKLRRRIRKIARTELTGKNRVKAVNSWAIPSITYSFGTIKWSNTDLEKLNRVIRVEMTNGNIHHPRACTERLYIPRSRGGRGLLNFTQLHENQIKGLRKYFLKKSETSTLHSVILSLDKYSPLQRPEPPNNFQFIEKMHGDWIRKPLHGKYPHLLSHACPQQSTEWLRRGYLFAETEGFIMAIQDGVIATRNYQKYIEKIKIESDTCRMCHKASETIEHIVSACSMLAPIDYLRRHNLTAGIIHQDISLQCKLKEAEEPYYKYVPEAILENQKYKIYWDVTILTDKTVQHNRPDITLVDKTSKVAYFIDVAHPGDHNLQQKEREKLNKYFELAQEYKQLLALQAVYIIPVVISATGLVTKNFRRNLQRINVSEKSITATQKSTILETCRIVRKVLNQ